MMTARGGMRRSRDLYCVRSIATIAMVLSTVVPATAQVQDPPPFDPAVDVQLFDYAIGHKSFLTVVDGDVEYERQFSLDFLLTFFTNPFTVYNFDDGSGTVDDTRTNVVENVLSGQLVGAYGLNERMQLGVSLPIIFSMQGNDVMVDTARAGEDLQATGLGDLLLEFKMKLWENEMWRLAGTAGVTAPSSYGAGGNDFLGDDLPTGRLRAAVQWTAPNNRITAGANLGVILRKPRTIYATEVGQQLTFGAGAAPRASDRRRCACSPASATPRTSATPTMTASPTRTTPARSWPRTATASRTRTAVPTRTTITTAGSTPRTSVR